MFIFSVLATQALRLSYMLQRSERKPGIMKPNTLFKLSCGLASLLSLNTPLGIRGEDGFLTPGGVVSPESSKDSLPPLKEIEKNLPSDILEGKQHLATLLPEAAKFSADTPASRSVQEALSLVMSRGEETDLIGRRINLDGIKPLDNSLPFLPSSRGFRIVRVLSVGPLSIDLLVMDDIRRVEHTLRAFAFVKDTSRDAAESLLSDALEAEVRGGKKALGATPAAAAVEEKGLAVPRYSARIYGAPDITDIVGAFVLSRVLLFAPSVATLGDVIKAGSPLPFNSKEYIARRLLALVMLLQDAGLSHNNLNLENLLFQQDGSIVLSGFGASVPFGEQIRPELLSVSLSLPFVSPELLFALEAQKTGETLFKGLNTLEALPASDMWSLGALIYGIFTDGKIPYGMTDATDSYRGFCIRMKELYDMNAHPDFIEEFIRGSGIRDRWNELLRSLLFVRSEDRTTAEQVRLSFPDLLGLPQSS
ncbi:hypothetical protein Emed_006796 [Eimeria media]